MTLGPFNSDLTPTAVTLLQNSFLLIINIYKSIFRLAVLSVHFAFAIVSIVHPGHSRRPPTEACFFFC